MRDDGPTVGELFCAAAKRGVVVKGLMWRSHLDKLQYSEEENQHLGDAIEQAGGEVLLDQRVRFGGSHHQKMVVIRHPDAPERDVAFAGGIDLCHSRRDDASHHGDPQAVRMAEALRRASAVARRAIAAAGPGRRRARHDVPGAVERPGAAGHAVADRVDQGQDARRGLDAGPSCRSSRRIRRRAGRMRFRCCAPIPMRISSTTSRRTVSAALRAPTTRWCRCARRLIYVEDQYLWSKRVADLFARALRDNPDLHLVAVVPRYADVDGRLALPPNMIGRRQALETCFEASPHRVHVFDVENHEGTPVYVHAKVCVIDDTWACVGSDNLNRRSWTHDSELSCAVLDHGRCVRARPEAADDARTPGPRGRRQRGRRPGRSGYCGARKSSQRQRLWTRGMPRDVRARGHRAGCGRTKPRSLGWLTRLWAEPAYRIIYDPDGRSCRDRLKGRL